MISEDCGVHSGVGGRITYQSAEALTYTYCWAGPKEENIIFYCIQYCCWQLKGFRIKCLVYWNCAGKTALFLARLLPSN